MSYSRAKLMAYDYTITDPTLLKAAAVALLARLNASDEDITDAAGLIARARRQS